MISLECYDFVFQVDGPSAMAPLLNKKGFETPISVGERAVLSSFRLESVGEFYDLYHGESSIAEAQALPLLCEMIVARVHLMVAGACPQYTFLRADSVKAPNGAGVLLAGPAFTGKTVLAKALVEFGAESWSYHFAVLDEMGRLLPYPAPSKPAEGLEVTALLNLSYRPGSSWRVDAPSAGQGAMHLLPLVTGAEEAIAQALPRLGAVSAAAALRYAGLRGGTEQVAKVLIGTSAWGSN